MTNFAGRKKGKKASHQQDFIGEYWTFSTAPQSPISEAHGALDAYVRWYNEERIHSALDYRTPSEAEDEWFKQKAA
ncbi:MAG: integrase core domain-containing protein [Deltaproteobacteria bacterium]|nr:integrase core domain-containing protein [Deltaproteobacteria bacterium]